MSTSFFCRLFGCGSSPTIYSAKIEKNQGFDSPVPVAGISGWTVYKHHQTEIYEIRHNLGLSDPARQLHVVATPMDHDIIIIVQSVERDTITISTWKPGNAAAGSDFMFTAVYRP